MECTAPACIKVRRATKRARAATRNEQKTPGRKRCLAKQRLAGHLSDRVSCLRSSELGVDLWRTSLSLANISSVRKDRTENTGLAIK